MSNVVNFRKVVQKSPTPLPPSQREGGLNRGLRPRSPLPPAAVFWGCRPLPPLKLMTLLK